VKTWSAQWSPVANAACKANRGIFVTRHDTARIKGAARLQRRKEGKIAMVMTEGIPDIAVVKGFAREANAQDRFARQNTSSTGAGVVSTRLTAQMDRLVQDMRAIGTCIVLRYGVTRLRRGVVSPGDLLAFPACLTTLYKPIRKMRSMTSRMATASGERLLEIFDIKPDIVTHGSAADDHVLHGHVALQSVTCGYPGASAGLTDATLHLPPGETVALIGGSGMGKSSVATRLMRFYDLQSGHITIDGHAIRDIDLASLRDQIAVVLPESVLFATSVRDTIAYGQLHATTPEIGAAVMAAGADGFIRRLPDGDATLHGERGQPCRVGRASLLPSPAPSCATRRS
jgi:ATP-binding cassette, subfamily B, bacterial